jgi:hypothetical protein
MMQTTKEGFMADRTKAGALEVIVAVRPASLALILNEDAKAILTDDFLTGLLDLAWHYQFEADRAGSRRALRQRVADAIEARMLGEANQ